MVDWVQYQLVDWTTGTDDLTFEQEAAYRKLMDAFYLTDGNLKDDDHLNAHRLKISTRKFRKLKTDLVEAGKIVIEDGLIRNEKARKTLEKTLCLSRNAREKAEKRWSIKRAKSLKSNETVSTGADAQTPLEQMQTRKLVTDNSNELSADLDAFLFARGKEILGPKSGGLIAKLKKNRGLGKAAEIIEAAADRENSREFVGACIRDGPPQGDVVDMDEVRALVEEKTREQNELASG